MSALLTPAGSGTADSYTHAQLHEAACIICGEPGGILIPAGHVRTEPRPGQFLTWAVVAHPEHLEQQ